MMAFRFTRTMMRCSHHASRAVAGAKNDTTISHFIRRSPWKVNDILISRSSSSTASTNDATEDASPRRRRRRRGVGGRATDPNAAASQAGGGGQRGDPYADVASPSDAASSAAFSPKDAEGNLLDAQEYLALASLSPWVPCPDMVIKRVFEIANATAEDVHADLGCGDGRLNFAAVGDPYGVKQSWGVDVDSNILEKCRERLGRRFVPRSALGLSDGNDGSLSEAERLEFLQADLIAVMERQKEKYQRQNQQKEHSSSGAEDNAPEDDIITQKLSQSTVVTMYFVHDALQQLQPYVASVLGGKENVRLVTVGYEMKGWEATWVERVLGLTVFKYDMVNVSNDPWQWNVAHDDEEGSVSGIPGSKSNKGARTSSSLEHTDFDIDPDDYTNINDDSNGAALAEYLQQKRQQDFDELDKGLTIHHDETLDDFAHAKRQRERILQPSSDNNIREREEWETIEDGWDFDETEDPRMLMKEAEKAMMEARRGGRGRGMMAGLDSGEKKKKEEKKGGGKVRNEAKAKPVWKKP